MSDTLLANTREHLLADSALAALVSTRLYPDAAPEGHKTFPFVVFFEVSLITDQALIGTTGLRECRIQYDCYAKSKKDALAIRERILAVFDGYLGTPVVGGVKILCTELSNQRTDYDHEEKIYSYSVDITYHYITT